MVFIVSLKQHVNINTACRSFHITYLIYKSNYQLHDTCVQSFYLKNCEQALPKTVKIESWLVNCRIKVEFPSKHLHSQKGKDHNEEKEKQQE